MAGSSLSRINGLGEFCMPTDGCRGRCAKHKPCRIADRYGCRWKLLTGWSFALYVSFSFLLLHLFCCIRTYGLRCPLLFASCCHECSGISVRDNCFFSWSLYRFFGAPHLRLPSRSSPKKTALGILESSILAT